MIVYIVILLLGISVILAILSLKKQTKLAELGGVKKELRKKKIVFQRVSESSSTSSE